MASTEIQRPEVLVLLECMGVKLQKNTKISDDDLSKRLAQTIDGAQRYTEILAPITPIDPSTLLKWKSANPLVKAVSRVNMAEAYANAMTGRSREGGAPTSTSQEDTFMEVRQVLMGMGKHFEEGHKTFVMKDKQGHWCIIARVVEVFSIGSDDDLPLFSILYKVLHCPKNMEIDDYLGQLFSEHVVVIWTTHLERKYLLKLFSINAKRLSSSYKPRREKHETDHRLTFIIPLGPLNMRDLGKLNNTPGCELCGKKMKSRCTQCLTVSYCGKECQREDWNNHKRRCRSLKGGSWHTLTFSDGNTPTGKMFHTVINRYDSVQDIRNKKIDDPEDRNAPPQDIHNEKAFLVKFQISLSQFGENSSMLLYDRQRSFQVYWLKAQDREVYLEGEKAMGDGLKIYRWARRVGDYQLAVCFDRAPETDPVW